MKIQKTFIQGKMNKDVDERLLPEGQYPHAENIRVGTTEDSAIGAVQNLKGNFKLTDLNLPNAEALGGYCDNSNEKIYWFVASDKKDLFIEYDFRNQVTDIILQSSKGGVLNLNKDFRITGVVKIINGDSDKDLIAWTDNYNPPRIVNIERAKTYGLDGFTENDISLIKAPPRFAPKLELLKTGDEFENNLEDKFFSFSYRYKYLDGEYSALSSFTNYAFFPSTLSIDFQTMENKGMKNSFNIIDISFNTGSKNVVGIELVYKASNSNTVFVIQEFDKDKEGWGNNEVHKFSFKNSKKYKSLAEDELFRTYDNVPLKALCLEIIGNRLVYGNYEEGYDLEDISGNKIKPDYKVELSSSNLSGGDISLSLINSDRSLIMDFTGKTLKKNGNLNVTFSISEDGIRNGFYRGSHDFVLNKDYENAKELAEDPAFINFIQVLISDHFIENTNLDYNDPYNPDPYDPYDPSPIPPDPISYSDWTGFVIQSKTTNTITIGSPTVTYADETTTTWSFTVGTYGTFVNLSGEVICTSLKTNRTYEAGIVYLDKYNRASLPVIDKNNTMFVSQFYSNNKNKLKLNINHKPPVWADRYKIVVKQDKGDYHNIFTNVFYEDGIYRWVKLEGENKDKVKEGDILIVKSDITGRLSIPVRVKVLEVEVKQKDFIEGNKLADGTTNLIEEAGLYMKIKPVGFNMNFNSNTVKTFQGNQGQRYPANCYTSPAFINPDGDQKIYAGSRVNIFIKFEAFGSISYIATYDKQFIVQADYPTAKDWFDAEVKNLGEFGQKYTRGGSSDPYRRGSGWDFTTDNRFWVRAHRDGTASRNIYTDIKFEIFYTKGVVIFETESKTINSDIFYETEQTFKIVDSQHQGNIQNQTSSLPAVVESDFHNVYVQGLGVESYRFEDGFNTNFLNIDLRPTMVAVEEYKKVRRFADLTYCEPYNENNNVNGLNEFNLSRANYKEDIDKKYGHIQKLHSRDNDLIVFQEDKVSKVLFGKDLLMNADGTSNLSAINDVLGRYIPYMGEYGISSQPEGFAYDGFSIYFPDIKRGAVMRLAGDGLNEISKLGMNMYFKGNFKEDIKKRKIGGFDPHHDEYILNCGDSETISFSETVKGWTSFYSFVPELMLGMNNNFFSFKNGELYIHHSGKVKRNTFYGVQYPSKISVMFNDSPSIIKEILTVSLEGNYSWDSLITAFVSSIDDNLKSSIKSIEFVQKEGIWYGYARRNEDSKQLDSKSSYGVGKVLNTGLNTITVLGYNDIMVEGDVLVKGSDLSIIGTIQKIEKNGNETTLTMSSTTGVLKDDFVVGMKNPRVEGGNLRGYTMRFDMEIMKDDKVELFAVNNEVIKSNP